MRRATIACFIDLAIAADRLATFVQLLTTR
jgi:hypothetical protein